MIDFVRNAFPCCSQMTHVTPLCIQEVLLMYVLSWIPSQTPWLAAVTLRVWLESANRKNERLDKTLKCGPNVNIFVNCFSDQQLFLNILIVLNVCVPPTGVCEIAAWTQSGQRCGTPAPHLNMPHPSPSHRPPTLASPMWPQPPRPSGSPSIKAATASLGASGWRSTSAASNASMPCWTTYPKRLAWQVSEHWSRGVFWCWLCGCSCTALEPFSREFAVCFLCFLPTGRHSSFFFFFWGKLYHVKI